MSKFNDIVRLYTRHGNEVSSLFQEIYQDLELPDATIPDGELIVPGPDGTPIFEHMMERFHSKKSEYYVQYCVFDILYYKGQKVTHLPLMERKSLLMDLEFDEKRMVHVQWVEGNGIPYFNLVKERGLEGIVHKKQDSKYEINKRSDNWLKVINYSYLDVLITGMVKKDNSFLLSSINDGTNIGVMEFVPYQERKYIHEKVRNIGVKETDKLIIFNEGIKCNVKFRNWTSNQILRIPSFHTWIS